MKKFHFSEDAWNYNNIRLTNQIFKLLPMYENGEDWESQLQNLIIEFHGYNDIFEDNPNFMIMIAKLNGLKHIDNKVEFRKLIFEAISSLKEIKKI